MFNNGYYIETTKNTTAISYSKDSLITLYQIVKDTGKNQQTLRSYLAHDVVKTFEKEFGARVVRREKLVIWLNDNPERFVPAKGHKIDIIDILD